MSKLHLTTELCDNQDCDNDTEDLSSSENLSSEVQPDRHSFRVVPTSQCVSTKQSGLSYA